MPSTYTLGKDYTVSGLTGVSDLTYTKTGERIDVTTRAGTKPYKKTVSGFPDETFECTVFAEASTVFEIGAAQTVTINGASLSMIIMTANREEPVDGVVTYKLTMKKGNAAAETCPV